MPRGRCPECRKAFSIADDEVSIMGYVYCPHCDSQLEIVDEHPIVLALVED